MTPIDASVRFHSFQVCSSRNWPRAGDETIGGLLPKQATPSTSRRGVAMGACSIPSRVGVRASSGTCLCSSSSPSSYVATLSPARRRTPVLNWRLRSERLLKMARTRQCAKFPFRCCSRKSGVPSNSTSWETLCLLPHLNCTGSGVAPPADSSVPPALATFELHP
eukprot:scaffold181872_cov18-Tisochrysis_lutea.AAC.1